MINCILIDDEPFALEILADDLLQFNDINILGQFSRPSDAKEFLHNQVVDLIFSDIQMPEMLGTQFVRNLENPPLVIFTTAYHQYAVEGFELNAVDYLTKPIRAERLALAIEKVRNLINLKNQLSENEPEAFIVIYTEYKKVKLFYNEIIYIEGLKDYVKIHLEGRVHPVLTRTNLKGMEAKLSEKTFLRIHNSYIVNKQKITKFTNTEILIHKLTLPISKKYQSNMEKTL